MIDVVLEACKLMKCNSKTHFHSRLAFFSVNLGHTSDEYSDRFHPVINEIVNRWNTGGVVVLSGINKVINQLDIN